MDRETIALIIAQNGLKTTATLITAKAVRLRAKAERATDEAAKAKLLSDADKASKLATALRIADEGINQYQIEVSV